MKYPHKLRALGCVAVTLLSLSVHAQADPSADAGEAALKLSGFGTLGASYHNAPGVTVRRDTSQAQGAQGNQLSFIPDSMLGVQAALHISPQFEAVLQIVSHAQIPNSYTPHTDWAYVKYQPVEDFSLRAGRVGIETYLHNDAAAIDYANLMIRRPVIYIPRLMNGMDAEYLLPVGEGTLRGKIAAGKAVGKLTANGNAPVDIANADIYTGSIEYSYRGWTGRLAYFNSVLRNNTAEAQPGSPLFQMLAMLPNGAELRNMLTMQNRSISAYAVAFAYDEGPLQATASYNRIVSPHWNDQHVYYGHAGYRLDSVTPYLSYSARRTARRFIPTGLPQGLSPQTDLINAAMMQAQTNFFVNQTDFALGLRYDLARNVALKVQADHIRYQDPDAIIDPTLPFQPAAARGFKSLTWYSAALNFVF